MNKIITLEQLEELSQKLKQENKSIVLAGGCFDILHLGHISFLEKAKQTGDTLILLLESDETIRKIKGTTRPIHTQKERAFMLSHIDLVDYIVLLSPHMTNEEYDRVVTTIKPAIIAATTGDKMEVHKKRQAERSGAQFMFVNKPIPNLSTSSIIAILGKES